MLIVTQTAADTFQVEAKAHLFTIIMQEAGSVITFVANASTRAYGKNLGKMRMFPSIADAEAAYKSLSGVSALIAMEGAPC